MYLTAYSYVVIAAAVIMLMMTVWQRFKQYKLRREQVDWRWEWEK